MFRDTRHIHFVAVGGIGMSGLAEVLVNLGFKVSGSDLRRSRATERLTALGATVFHGHAAEQIEGADVVVFSSAVTESNPEVAAARSRRIPVIRRGDMLAELMRLKFGIAVAGSHGKTTTTSLVAAVLAGGGLDPTVLVGGRVLATGANAVLGAGDYLVAEADESDGSFLSLTPTIAVVTNIDLEHVDFFPDLDRLREAFAGFLDRVPFYGSCVLCADDPEVRVLATRLDRKVVTYGFGTEAEVRVRERHLSQDQAVQIAEIEALGESLGELKLPVRGAHNLLNALAAVAVARELGIDFARTSVALEGFAGVGRRCEERGEHGGVLVVDDYGHHPTEIVATLEVARSFGRPVTVLFQPHRYSRTARFRREFADALAGADNIGLLPIYAASEEPIPGIESGGIAESLREKGIERVEVLTGPEHVNAWLDRTVTAGDFLLTLGAGDIGRLVDPICVHLDAKGQG